MDKQQQSEFVLFLFNPQSIAFFCCCFWFNYADHPHHNRCTAENCLLFAVLVCTVQHTIAGCRVISLETPKTQGNFKKKKSRIACVQVRYPTQYIQISMCFGFHHNALFVLITISNTRSKRVNENITGQYTHQEENMYTCKFSCLLEFRLLRYCSSTGRSRRRICELHLYTSYS